MKLDDCPLCQKITSTDHRVEMVDLDGAKAAILTDHRGVPDTDEAVLASELLAGQSGAITEVDIAGHWGIKTLSGNWEQGKSSMYSKEPSR